MNIIRNDNVIIIENAEDFVPELTFECGQAFRWKKTGDGGYIGIVAGTPLKVSKKADEVMLTCRDADDFEKVWNKYFDFSSDYRKIRGLLNEVEKLKPAIEYGTGIRILRQEFWEALCSFIISQCNNIPRIKGIIETLCANFGEKLIFEGEKLYSFPEPQIVAQLTEEDLSVIRSGYRAKYLIGAAKAVVNGELSEDKLNSLDIENARKELMNLNGVGKKVADCVLLYGLGRLSVYPVDVWMKRVAQEFFEDSSFDGSVFGKFAGVAQQYLFHYIRGLNGKNN